MLSLSEIDTLYEVVFKFVLPTVGAVAMYYIVYGFYLIMVSGESCKHTKVISEKTTKDGKTCYKNRCTDCGFVSYNIPATSYRKVSRKPQATA